MSAPKSLFPPSTLVNEKCIKCGNEKVAAVSLIYVIAASAINGL